jgi:beta-glucuronidase
VKTYPLYKKRKSIDLNRIWDFKFLEDVEFDKFDVASVEYDDRLPVPSTFDAFPAYNGKRGSGVYRCFVDVPPNTNALLKIGAAGMYCKVFVDGKIVGEHYSAYTAFECKVPKSKNETRELVIMTCNRFDYNIYPLHEIFFDFYAYGGIFRNVEIQLLPDGTLIDWVGVDTLDYQTGKGKVTVKSSGCQNLSINVDVQDEYDFTDIDFSNGESEFELNLKGLELWSPESPCLHTLTVDNGIDSVTVRFGIRQVWTEKGEIILNGKAVKLLGFCRHEAHPQYGPALPYQQLIADLQLLRDMGCNFVRGSHYPQDPRFLNLCDEMGILVFEESMGWGQKVKHFTDPKFIAAQLKQTEEMIIASYNHPSIIIRAFLNEGESNFEECRSCYEALTKLVREKDPHRLVTYASNKELKDRFLELVDVVCFNIYPAWYCDINDENPLEQITERITKSIDGLKERGLSDKPFIISEIGAGAIYGWRDPICAHWSEEYQDEYLKIVCNEVVSNESIAGVALWQFCDCRTYRGAGALMRPRAFNNKGIVDEYRRPKLAYKSVKKIFEDFNNNENK